MDSNGDRKQSSVRDAVFGAVDVETLLGAGYDQFASLLAREQSGPMAVVGPPYSGRERVLDVATDRLDARSVRLGPGADGSAVLDNLGDGPLIVGGCHHLYERRVDGFDPLMTVLDALSEVDTTVVTGWNSTAWAYLDAIWSVERSFPMTVEIQPLDTETITIAIEAAGDVPTYRRPDPGDRPLFRSYPIGWRDYEIPIPIPDRLVRSFGTETDAQAAVFQQVQSVANGNLGVADALVQRLSGEQVYPGDVTPIGADLDIDADERFALRLLVGSELADRSTLAEIVGSRPEPLLGRLAREGVVTIDGDHVSLEPAAVPTATATVNRGRIL